MPTKRSLAVVPAARPSKRPLTVQEAAHASHRELLVAIMDKITREIDAGVPARDLASLSRRVMEIARDIEAIDLAAQQDRVRRGNVADDSFDASAI